MIQLSHGCRLLTLLLFTVFSPRTPGEIQFTRQIISVEPLFVADSEPVNVSEIDRLTDDQLIELYELEYDRTLTQQSIDQSRLVTARGAVLEMGYSFSHRRDVWGFEYQTHTFPELLLRYRLRESVELRLGWAGTTSDIFSDPLTGFKDRDQILADPSVGLRFALHQQNRWWPSMSLTTSTSVATNNQGTAGSGFRPQAALSYSWMTGENCLLTGSTGAIWSTNDAGEFFDLQQSAALNYFVDDHCDIFVEWFGTFPVGVSGMSSAHSAGPGFSYALNEHLQLSLNASFGLNNAASDILAQVRIAWRL